MGFTLEIGSPQPDFELLGVDGKTYSLSNFAEARALLIVFACNHCPFVIGSEERMKAIYEDYFPKGLELISINSNETDNNPTDSFEHMIERAKEKGFKFPYVRDESQDVARAYGALRTPHFFLFDADRRLRYTGRMDDNPRNPGSETTRELCDAIEAVLAGRCPAVEKTNPIGCNVKWKNRDPHWMPPEACDLV